MSAIEVAHRVEGPAEAPVLVLSNSLGSTMAMWDPQMPALRRRFRVVRYDHRGHGESPVPPEPYELSDLGGDALALLDRLGVERAHVCGVSLGGMVGMWLGINAPERVDRLVLCCTSAMLSEDHDWAARAATVREGGTVAVAEAVVDRWFTAGFAAANPDLVQRMRAMVAATPSTGYAGCCGAIERMDLRPGLAGVRAPTLVLAGEHDPATRPVHAEHVELPDAVTELIVSHLLDEHGEAAA
jgi:3-oxoadipate enol-lactonase